jgi:hypothetical protein
MDMGPVRADQFLLCFSDFLARFFAMPGEVSQGATAVVERRKDALARYERE